jgi:hypothetical protein
MNGSPKVRERVFNILDQISVEAVDDELIRQSVRMVKRAGVPMHKTYLERYQQQQGSTDQTELGKTDSQQRRQEVTERMEWERRYQQQQQQPSSSSTTMSVGDGIARNVANSDGSSSSSSTGGKSALSRRVEGTAGKPDMFMSSVLDPDSIATIAKDRNDLQREMNNNNNSNNSDASAAAAATTTTMFGIDSASARVSEMIAKAGSGTAFEGQTLGIGGLDDVLTEIKRRIWTPLAAPPQLLKGMY